MGPKTKEHFWEYLGASALAASINYPLWRVSAMGQSGFVVQVASDSSNSQLRRMLAPYMYAFSPPYKGMMATIMGMTWARAAIFYGSDLGKELIKIQFPGAPESFAILFPPLVVSTFVQIVNMPLVRSTITLQNPAASDIVNIRGSLKQIYSMHGVTGLWHGTSAGILKSVPKYCTAVFVKDWMENVVSHPDPSSPSYNTDCLARSASKSVIAGVAGATLTNPLDVIRNEMFKTNLGLFETVSSLYKNLGWSFMTRGMGKNLVAVSIPVASTIFFTDALIQYNQSNKVDEGMSSGQHTQHDLTTRQIKIK